MQGDFSLGLRIHRVRLGLRALCGVSLDRNRDVSVCGFKDAPSVLLLEPVRKCERAADALPRNSAGSLLLSRTLGNVINKH